jgi:hypothetical protein
LHLLLQNNAFALFLPSHTTHLLQPLDNLVFATFKGVVSLHQDQMNKANKLYTQRINNVIEEIITEAEKQAFKKKSIIKKYYANTGLWPPNFERIHELVREQCEVDLRKEFPPKTKDYRQKFNNFLNSMLCRILLLHKKAGCDQEGKHALQFSSR